MNLPIIILGGGGHSKVLIEALLQKLVIIEGIIDTDPLLMRQTVLGVPIIGSDEIVTDYPSSAVRLVNGLGSVTTTKARRALFERFSTLGYLFESVIHPSAVVASDVELGEGVQVMAGAVIQPGSSIGRNSIVNTKASVDHDCRIGDHVHLAPGVTISGNVSVGNGVHIGTGATIIQGVSIGANSVVGAGTLVLRNVPERVTVIGVPGKVMKR